MNILKYLETAIVEDVDFAEINAIIHHHYDEIAEDSILSALAVSASDGEYTFKDFPKGKERHAYNYVHGVIGNAVAI